MAAIRITIGDDVFETGTLSLGELRTIKRLYGVRDLQGDLAESDPDAIAGLIHVAVARANPEWELKRVTNYVDAVTGDDGFTIEAVEADDAPDPTVAAPAAGE